MVPVGRLLQAFERELPIEDGQDEGTECAHGRGVGRGGEAPQDAAENGQDQECEGNDPEEHLSDHLADGFCALLEGQCRAQGGIDVAPDQGIGHIQPGQHQSRHDAGGEQVGNRNPDDGSHHDQHDARRNKHAERPARSDRACAQANAVAAFLHHRSGHHAEDRHRRADDTRGRGEQRSREYDGDIQGPPDRPQHEAEAVEQPIHQSRLFQEIAHEQE